MSQSLISVIVPVYNVKEYLNTCVESILNQTHENLEVILVDDGSTDGSGEICDSYAKTDTRVQVRIWYPAAGEMSMKMAESREAVVRPTEV